MKAGDLGELMLFYSARDKKLISLADYVAAMPKGQDTIYYAAGTSTERLAQQPMVASALSHGFDVLLCTQDIDEFMFGVWRSYHAQLPVVADAAAQDASAKDADVKDAQDTAAKTEEKDLTFTNVSTAGLNFASDDYANLLLNQALLVEGLEIKNPAQFARDICKLM